ncbi:hypothetical protein [Sinomonas humi]|uniref:hypothetical protein n=1 Tax=Sinomonas humi TaxID=1338436 RepID=UPI0012E01C16|nr:hypothetical protein [Sinomonas humi]
MSRPCHESFCILQKWQGLGRPGLDANDDVTRRTLERYNGIGNAAIEYGYELLGVYRVFEKYHRMLRER